MRTEPVTVLIAPSILNTGYEKAAERWRWRITPTGDCGVGLAQLAAALPPRGDLTAARPYPAQLILAVPAECTITASVGVPSNKPQHIRAVVPNLLEEGTASELDELHIAFGGRSPQGEVPVVAIDQEQIAAWLTLLDNGNASWICDAAYVDALLLPHASGTVSVLIEQDRALLRWSAHQGGAVAIDALEIFLSALLPREAPQRLVFWLSDNTENGLHRAEAIAKIAHQNGVTPERQPFEGDTLALWTSTLEELAGQYPVNLRQGAMARADADTVLWQRWRPLAYATAAVLAGFVVLNTAIGMLLTHRADALHAQSLTLYRELFPQDRRIVNLPQQLLGHLGGTADSSTGAFLPLFGQLAQAIQATPAGQSRASGDTALAPNLSSSSAPPLPATPVVQLRSLTFDTSASMLQVDIAMPSVAWLDSLQQRLHAAGLKTQVMSIATETDTLVGRLRLSQGAR